MATDVPVVKIHHAPEAARSARDRLIDAMDIADLLGHAIPCKGHEDEFTSDLLAFNSGQAQMLAADLARKCRRCPVLGECRDHVRETRRNQSVRMYGVVAGYLVLPNTTHRIDPEGDA